MRQRKSASVSSSQPAAAEVTTPKTPVSTKKAQEAALHASPYISESDFIDSWYHPHTITAGVILLSVIAAMWKWYYLPGDMISSIKLGLAAAVWSFLVFGTLHLPDGLMVRPHPAVWRFFLSAAVLYMMALVFAVFQDVSTIKQLFAWYDPVHLVVIPEQSYAEDCRLSTPEEPYKFWTTISDVFLLAHSVGYWGKMVVIRDWRIVTAISIFFEVVEVSLQHQLPNFKECWWDHLICDVLICNGGGTVLGWLTLKLLNAKTYNWVRVADIPTFAGKAGRVLTQFTPRSFESFHWDMFKSFKRFVQVAFVFFVVLLQDMNAFLLKNMLNQSPTNHLVPARIMMWGFMAIPALREYYCFVNEPKVKRLGTMAWVCSVAMFFETFLAVKMALQGGYFRAPTPAVIGIPWSIAASMLLLWLVLFFGCRCLQRYFVTRHFLNLMLYGSFAVLAVMCAMANVDTQWKLEEFNAFVEKHNLW